MTKRHRTDIVGLLVRMREPLRKKIEQAAKSRGVSMNSEVVARLEQSFQTEDIVAGVREQVREEFRQLLAGLSKRAQDEHERLIEVVKRRAKK
jgi:hypothetical protein